MSILFKKLVILVNLSRVHFIGVMIEDTSSEDTYLKALFLPTETGESSSCVSTSSISSRLSHLFSDIKACLVFHFFITNVHFLTVLGVKSSLYWVEMLFEELKSSNGSMSMPHTLLLSDPNFGLLFFTLSILIFK